MRRRDFLAALPAAVFAAPPPARIVVAGDIHGDLDRFIDVLTMAALLDSRQRWAGGAAQLVQLGNATGSGSKSPQVIDFLITLDRQARQARGRVWPLIGNNEAMRLRGDLDAVSPAEYESFRTAHSEREREKYFQRELARSQAQGDPARRADLALGYRQSWEKQHPLGQAELLRAFSPAGPYGKWILSQPAVLTLGGSLLLHAGIAPKYAQWSESRFNDRVRSDIVLPPSQSPEDNIAQDPQGPLAYRGFAQSSEESLAPLVTQLLAFHGVSRIIAGHMPTPAAIVSRLQGRLIIASSGPACVVIENGQAFALDGGRRTPLS